MDNVVHYLTGETSTISNFDNLKKREHPFDFEQAKIKIVLASCFREYLPQCNTKNLFFKIW